MEKIAEKDEEKIRMKFIVDTNIIISALIKDSVTRQLIFISRVGFYAPTDLLDEVIKYKEEIKKKANLNEVEFAEVLALAIKYIVVVPKEKYIPFMEDAIKTMKSIDEKDAPYIALALTIKADGIWSDEKHFKKQDKVNAFTTKEIVEILRRF